MYNYDLTSFSHNNAVLTFSALKLDKKDPALALNYSIFLYNQITQTTEDEHLNQHAYAAAIEKLQIFEHRVQQLRGGAGMSTGVDADPTVLSAASALADCMDYSLSIAIPAVGNRYHLIIVLPRHGS